MPCLPTVRPIVEGLAGADDIDLSITNGTRVKTAGGVDVEHVEYMPNLVQDDERSAAA